jgi:hypothetical protein
MLPRFTVLVVLGVVFWLTPLAQASPPDQTWIGGLYDDADYDDVVLLVTGSLHAVRAAPVPALESVSVVVDLAHSTPQGAHAEPVRLAETGRAPPLS